ETHSESCGGVSDSQIESYLRNGVASRTAGIVNASSSERIQGHPCFPAISDKVTAIRLIVAKEARRPKLATRNPLHHRAAVRCGSLPMLRRSAWSRLLSVAARLRLVRAPLSNDRE